MSLNLQILNTIPNIKPVVGAGAGVDNLLLETGDNVLLETGDVILLE
jgi:hypothetical protein